MFQEGGECIEGRECLETVGHVRVKYSCLKKRKCDIELKMAMNRVELCPEHNQVKRLCL